MQSPKYETIKDLGNEFKVVAMLEEIRPDLIFEKIHLPKNFGFSSKKEPCADFEVYDRVSNKKLFYLEIRCRNNAQKAFQEPEGVYSIMFNKTKIDHLIRKAPEYPHGSWIVARWNKFPPHVYGVCNVPKIPKEIVDRTTVGGREKPRTDEDGTQTIDPNDITDLVHIPINLFMPIIEPIPFDYGEALRLHSSEDRISAFEAEDEGSNPSGATI